MSDGLNTYTYGLGRISQSNTTSIEYFMGDALGSVRQLTAGNGDITLTKSYDPYGEVVQSSGSGQSIYGFTGETADANGLIYLRARYYNPVDGRFLSRDTWGGIENLPISFNKWGYANANPIKFTDPSGQWVYPMPPEGERFLKDHEMVSAGIILGAKALYSKFGLSRLCRFSPEPIITDTIDDLVTNYVCEYGGPEHTFGSDSPLTQQIIRMHSIYELRRAFYASGGQSMGGGSGFGLSGFVWAKLDIVFAGSQIQHFFLNVGFPLNISDYLGSYTYEISQTSQGAINFEIRNTTSLESGTRIAPRTSDDDVSLEQYWLNPELHKDKKIVSILSSKDQDETMGLEGGGSLKQTFTWDESYDPYFKCLNWYPPYPFGLSTLKILPGGN